MNRIQLFVRLKLDQKPSEICLLHQLVAIEYIAVMCFCHVWFYNKYQHLFQNLRYLFEHKLGDHLKNLFQVMICHLYL